MCASSAYIIRNEIAGLENNYVFVLLFNVELQIYTQENWDWGLFNICQCDGDEILPYCDFNLHFSGYQQ
jgi:hypothetical protein